MRSAISCDVQRAMTSEKGFPRLLNINEAADVLAVKPATLRSWVLARRNIPFVRVGRLIRFKQGDLTAWIEKNTVPVREQRNGQR